MSRWWANAEESRQMLDLVDDSDVEQGVGTAILAYHGLAAGALEPLTRKTLMDVSAVRHALAGVDLEPVAKALAAATSPVVGDAAGRYGEILADDLHAQATEATERLLLSLTNSGMPWPTAIERVATVHGVPLERLGQAASKLAAPALTPLVRADLGDRALMDYAMHRGLRENTVVDVSKASAAQKFDPNEHPRGAKGQFRRKPARQEPDAALVAREARSMRDKRQARTKVRQENARRALASEAPATERSLMGMLTDMFSREEPKANETVTRLTFRERRAQANARRRPRAGGADEQKADLQAPIAQTKNEWRIDGERAVIVHREWADRLIKEGGMVSGRLEDAMYKMGWLAPDEVKGLLNEATDNPGMLTDYVVLEIVDDIPVNGGGRRDDQVQVARSAVLTVASGATDPFDAYDRSDTYTVKVRGNKRHPVAGKRVDHDFRMPVLRLAASNADSYDKHHDDGPPVMKAFDANEHPRGAKGRFRNKPDRLEPDLAAIRGREARDARSKRDRRSMRGQPRRTLAAVPEEQRGSLMAQLAERIKADPLAQDLDSVDQLAERRHRRSFRELARERDRGRKKARPVGDLDLKTAQVFPLTDDQVLSLDRVGQQDIDPMVQMASVLSDDRRQGHDAYIALLNMRDKARAGIDRHAKGTDRIASFGEEESYATSEEAYAAGQEFQQTLAKLSRDGSGVMWEDESTGRMRAWTPDVINASTTYVEGFNTRAGEHRFRPRAIAKAGGIDAQTMMLGSEKDMAMLKAGVLPDDVIESETTFREVAAKVGLHPDMINSTPDFVIRTIRPVFGHNDE